MVSREKPRPIDFLSQWEWASCGDEGKQLPSLWICCRADQRTGLQVQKYIRDLPLIASTISVSVDQYLATDSSSAFETECRAPPQDRACIPCLVALHLRSHKRFIHPRPQPCSLSPSRPALWCPAHLGHPLSFEGQRVSTKHPPSQVWRSSFANHLGFIYAALS